MQAGRLADFAKRRTDFRRVWIAIGSIAEPDDSDEALLIVADRKPADLLVCHCAERILDAVVWRTRCDVSAHDAAHRHARAYTAGNSTDCNVPVSHDADQLA